MRPISITSQLVFDFEDDLANIKRTLRMVPGYTRATDRFKRDHSGMLERFLEGLKEASATLAEGKASAASALEENLLSEEEFKQIADAAEAPSNEFEQTYRWELLKEARALTDRIESAPNGVITEELEDDLVEFVYKVKNRCVE